MRRREIIGGPGHDAEDSAGSILFDHDYAVAQDPVGFAFVLGIECRTFELQGCVNHDLVE